jgi:uncharacterized membrane protein HdeD (DUF308 family)
MDKKQWVKIATLSAPIIALVVGTIAGLDENAQSSIQEVVLTVIAIVAGAVGVGGVVANNDKNGNGIDDSQE